MKVCFSFTDGIVTGDTKRFIEKFGIGISFKQRKSYDEYYPSVSGWEKTTLEEISSISEYLDVSIKGEYIYLTER